MSIDVEKKRQKFGIVFVFSLLGLTLLISALFLIDGLLSLFLWQPLFTYPYIFVMCMSFIAPIFLYYTSVKGVMSGKKVPLKKVFIVFMLIGFILPISLFSINIIAPTMKSGNKPPQLLISSSIGAYNIPDIAISFYTDQKSTRSIEWGAINGTIPFTQILTDDYETNSHVFMLQDLYPSSTYRYCIDSIEYIFDTPSNDTILSFAVLSDVHFGSHKSNSTARNNIFNDIKNKGFDYVMSTGDIVNYGFIDSQWSDCINTISETTSYIPFRPILGNHDSILGGRQIFADYFYPYGMDIGNGTQYYYRIDIGEIHFICLELEYGMETVKSDQRNWLVEQLEDIDENDWTIVFTHSYIYSSAAKLIGDTSTGEQKGIVAELIPIFELYGVDMVFSGHIHTLEYLQKGEISYNIVGGCGTTRFDTVVYENEYSIWRLNNQFGYAGVSIDDLNATISFYSDLGSTVYSYTIEREETI